MTYQNNLHIRQCPILVMAVLATILSCCSTNRHQRLEGVLATVDSMTNAMQYNDSAISLLEQVRDSMLLQDEASRMAYKLMCVKAYDRARQPYDGEDEILDILEYYENKGDEAMLPVALYYAGRHSAKQHDAPSALRYFHRAHELIASDSANVLNGWICGQSCYLYSQQMLYEESRRFFTDGLRYNMVSKDTMSMIYSIRDIGGSYQMVGDKATCDTCLHKALRLAEAKRDTMMIRNIQLSLSDNNIEMGRYDSAMVYLRPVLANPLKINKSPIYTNASRIYYHLNQPDSALFYIEKVLDVGTIQGKTTAYRNHTRIDLTRGDVAAARGDFENYVLCIDSVNRITASEALAKAAATYDYTMKENENMRLKDENLKTSFLVWTWAAACVTLLMLLLLGYMYFKTRRMEDISRSHALERALDDSKKQFNEFQIKHQCEIEKQVRNVMKMIDGMKSFGSDIKDEKDLLLRELATFVCFGEKEMASQQRLLETVEMFKEILLKKKMPTPNEWNQLKESIMEVYPGLWQFVPTNMFLSEIEERVCWLTKLYFSPSHIGILVGRSPQSINSIRARLYKKIFQKKGSAKDFDELLKRVESFCIYLMLC